MMTLMKRCEQKIVSDYVSCSNKIDIVETDMITKVNCLFFCVWTIFSEVWLSSIKGNVCRNDAMRLVTYDNLMSKAFLFISMTNIKKCLFCSRTLEKKCINHKSKLQMVSWFNLIKIDLFLELDDKFGQVYPNLDKFKPIRGKNAQIILNPKGG